MISNERVYESYQEVLVIAIGVTITLALDPTSNTLVAAKTLDGR